MVHIGILGTGGMAEYQAKKLSAVAGCVLSACKDHKADNAEAFARRFAIPAWYTSVNALLEEGAADALSCVVIDSRHRALCEPVIGRRLPLFCEKPLARTLADCIALTAKAAEAGVPNLVNFSKRNAPALPALKQALNDGVAGEVLGVEAAYLQGWVTTWAWGDWMTVPRWRWRLLPELGTAGVVGDLGTHLVDALLYLFGGLEPEANSPPSVLRLSGAMEAGIVPARDLPEEFSMPGAADGTVPVRFEATARLGPPWGGAPVRLRASWVDQAELDAFRVTVTGSLGRLELDLRRSRETVRLVPADGSEARNLAGPGTPSTYELFVRMAEAHTQGRPPLRAGAKGQEDLPTFAHALAVHQATEALLPGVMPV